jgi:hypothetical protein
VLYPSRAVRNSLVQVSSLESEKISNVGTKVRSVAGHITVSVRAPAGRDTIVQSAARLIKAIVFKVIAGFEPRNHLSSMP